MKFKLALIAALFVFLFITSCSPSGKHYEAKTEQSFSQLPAGFEEFFEQFHLDSSFQMNHTVFPLEGKRSNGFQSEEVYWSKKEWKLHKPFNPSWTDFSQSFQVFGEIVTETIQDKMGISKIQRRFAKLGEEWMLIYYSEEFKAQ